MSMGSPEVGGIPFFPRITDSLVARLEVAPRFHDSMRKREERPPSAMVYPGEGGSDPFLFNFNYIIGDRTGLGEGDLEARLDSAPRPG